MRRGIFKMPKIKIPADVIIYNDEDKPVDPPYTFIEQFVHRTLLRDQSWYEEADKLIACQEIRGKFNKDMKEGELVELSHHQYQLLERVAKKPRLPYHMLFGQCLSYLHAILKPEEST